ISVFLSPVLPVTLEAFRMWAVPFSNSAAAFAERTSSGFEIVFPDPQVRWRVTCLGVERSTIGGGVWETVPISMTADFTAGAAPLVTVCWLVGRRGVVMLSVDGRTWRSVTFPEPVDLLSVRVADARTTSMS